jgi:type IV secretory pathway VirB4 component
LDNENNRNNDLTINDFANKMLKGHKLLNNCFEALFMFIGEGVDAGPYAHFFKKTASFRNTDLICFDLAGLGSHAQLKSVFIPALLDLISTNILSQSDFSRRKLIVCDEAWRDLQGGDMQSFMQEMSRTIRKLNGSISIISQSLADIFDSAIGGALLTNTSYFWLVGSKHEFKYLTQLKASSSKGENVLTEYEATRIVQQTSQRDTWLLSPFYNGQLRLKPSKEFVMVSTTNPKHKQILQKHMERLGHKFVTPEVIQAAKEEF